MASYFISPARMEQLEAFDQSDALITVFNLILAARGFLSSRTDADFDAYRPPRYDWFVWDDALCDLMRKMKPTVYARLDKLDSEVDEPLEGK